MANEAVPNFKAMLMVNTFSHVDEILEDVILKAMEQFTLCPQNRPEMAYNFLSVLLHSKSMSKQQIMEKFKMNPITPRNRIHILRGCMNSINCKDLVKKIQIPMTIVHSMKNCVINIGHVDHFKQIKEDRTQLQDLNMKQQVEKKPNKRIIKYLDGGHDVIEENPEEFQDMVITFISNAPKK